MASPPPQLLVTINLFSVSVILLLFFFSLFTSLLYLSIYHYLPITIDLSIDKYIDRASYLYI